MSTKCINLICLLLTVFCLSFVISCKNDSTFAAENKTVIDTMFMNRNKVLKLEIDSICPLDPYGIYRNAYDSIYAHRIEMIKIELGKANLNQ